MFSALLLVAAAVPADPRLALTQLQLQGKTRETLAAVEQSVEENPGEADRLGLNYLRGHLLEGLGRVDDSKDAFALAMGGSPSLAGYSRYRMATSEMTEGHPEVAAGLLSRLLSSGPPKSLERSATELFILSLRRGGDCRLMLEVDTWPLPKRELRLLQLARSDCDRRAGNQAEAISRLLKLLEEDAEDETARGAAERLNRMKPQRLEDRATSILMGRVFHRNRLFGLSITYLRQGLGAGAASGGADAGATGGPAARFDPSGEASSEVQYALARSHFWQKEYLVAASEFGRLASISSDPEEKARALFQQGRCFELFGNWDAAVQSYRRAYTLEPEGRWSDAALISALRVDWRSGREESALSLYEGLATRRDWRRLYARAGLFLASSDLVRGRADRAAGWLDRALRADPDTEPEVDYWNGRLAEIEERWREAVESYLGALASERFHPFAQAARNRLRRPELSAAALELGRGLARSNDMSRLFHSWLLLGDIDPAGADAKRRLGEGLARDPRARAYLEIDLSPAQTWPLWEARLRDPEESLLALGLWREGAPVVAKHFPVAQPALGYTGSNLLAKAQVHKRSLRIAEILSERAEEEVPPGLMPLRFRKLLYPMPWAETIFRESESRNVDPYLLAALIREESRFDRLALSAASARGLTQFVLPTARRLAPAVGKRRISAADLHNPEISIALGSAYLAELAGRYGAAVPQVVAAYNAGERQAELWRSYCYSREPEEYLTKIGFSETRGYLRRVLTSWAEYRDLYGSRVISSG